MDDINPPVTPLKPSPAARMMTFVRNHKTALVVASTNAATASAMYWLHMNDRKIVNEFLSSEGLLEKFIESHPVVTK